MKRILLASAAVIALAFAAPMAGAQYTDPTPSPTYQTTPVPEPTPSDDPMAPTQQTPSTTATTDPYASTTTSTGAQTTTGTMPSTTADPTTSSMSSTTTTPSSTTSTTYGTTTTQTDPYAQPAQSTEDYGYDQPTAAAQSMPVNLSGVAEEAGMSGVPMTPGDVCQPRSISLESRALNTTARRHLIVAADHASVCELQRVVIHSPGSRADSVRQTLVDHGVDDGMIEVQSGASELGVDMTFSGVAASTPEYAAMFNGLASPYASTGAQPYGQPAAPGSTGMNQPSGYQSGASTYAPYGSPATTTPTSSTVGTQTTTTTTTYAPAGSMNSTTTTGATPTGDTSNLGTSYASPTNANESTTDETEQPPDYGTP